MPSLLVGFTVAVTPVIVVLLLLERTRRWQQAQGIEPPHLPSWMLPCVAVGGAGGGLLITLFLGGLLDSALAGRVAADHLMTDLLRSTVDAIAEEMGKIAIIIALVMMRATASQGRVGIFVLGLLAGASFACIENVIYTAIASNQGMSLVESFAIRIPVSAAIHPGATALLALALHELAGRRHAMAFFFIFTGLTIHVGWNALLIIVDHTGAGAAAAIAIAAPFLVFLLLGLLLRSSLRFDMQAQSKAPSESSEHDN